MNNKYLAKNDFFIAYAINLYENLDVYENRTNFVVRVYRRDTHETYGSFSLHDLNRKLWSSTANDIIKKLNKPEDWKRPHRYCLARYAKQVLKYDNFFHSLHTDLLNLQKSYHSIMLSLLEEGKIIKKNQSYENKSLILTNESSAQTDTLTEFSKPHYSPAMESLRESELIIKYSSNENDILTNQPTIQTTTSEELQKPYDSTSIETDQQEIEKDVYEEKQITLHETCLFFQKVTRYIATLRLTEAAVIKKLNQLSFEEKCQLFILKDWEWKSRGFEDVHYAIFGREYVYKRLYDKRKFTTHFKEFRERLNYLEPNYWPDKWEDEWEDE